MRLEEPRPAQSDSLYRKCGNSSVGRAQPCQGWGRGSESRFPLQRGPERNPDRKQKALYVSNIQGFFSCSPTPVEAKGSSHFIHGSYLSSSGLSPYPYPYPYAAPDRTERRNRLFGYRLYKAEAGQLINHIAAGCPASISPPAALHGTIYPTDPACCLTDFDIQPQSVKTAHSPMKSLRPFHPAGLPLLQTRRPQLCSAEVWNG